MSSFHDPVESKFENDQDLDDEKKVCINIKKIGITAKKGKKPVKKLLVCEENCPAPIKTLHRVKFDKHMFDVHEQTMCQICGKNFDNFDAFFKHKEVHTKKEKSKENKELQVCPDCGREVYKLSQHIKKFHKRIGYKKCDYCDYTAYYTDIKDHIERVHKESNAVNCPWCGQYTKDLKRHLKQNQCNVPEEERAVKEKLPCPICQKLFNKKRHLKIHIESIHEKINFKQCDQCQYKTSKNYNLKLHIKRVHEGKPLKEECPHCSKMVGSLEYHIKTYHGGIGVNSIN